MIHIQPPYTAHLLVKERYVGREALKRLRWSILFLKTLLLLVLCNLARDGQAHQQEDSLRDLSERVRALEQLSESRLPEADVALETAPSEPPETDLSIGGALRLNYSWRDFNDEDRDKVGDFGFELFRMDADGKYDDLGVSAQYRWYASFEAIHHGYVSYVLSPEWEAQLGIHQVPFGILPYASHSFWFGATYYLGLEDDYDTGLKLLYQNEPWDLQLAFYKNPEYVDSSRADRYSFDLVTSGDQANEETNQLNLRLSYDWTPHPCLAINYGASVEGGQIYNRVTQRMGDRLAWALHSNVVYNDWNLQLQWIDYQFRPINPPGVDPRTVQLAAFQFPFLVAAEAHVATINLARTISTDYRFLDSVTWYADFSKVYPKTQVSQPSTQLVLGCLFASKQHLFVYVDWIIGQNMWFAGGPGIGLSLPESSDWLSRLNINVGFYF